VIILSGTTAIQQAFIDVPRVSHTVGLMSALSVSPTLFTVAVAGGVSDVGTFLDSVRFASVCVCACACVRVCACACALITSELKHPDMS